MPQQIISREKQQFIEGLNAYYKLKDGYESAFNKEKNKLISNKDMSWSEKRREFAKLKPKCVNCKRPVKTIFETIVGEEQERRVVAKCGDRQNPCPLDIVIHLGWIENLKTNIQNDKSEINDLKRNVIVDKNDLLFGYTSSSVAVERFNALKESIEMSTKFVDYYTEIYDGIVNNHELDTKLDGLEKNINDNINGIQKLVGDFERTKNTQFVCDAVNTYVNEVIPKCSEWIDSKYMVRGIEYDDTDDTHHLVFIPFEYSIEKMEIDIADKYQQGIVKFQVGMTGFLQSNNKPSATTQKVSTSKEEEEEESEEEESEEEESEEEESEEEEEGEDVEKIKIHDESDIPVLTFDEFPTERIDASKANELKYTFKILHKEMVATDPKTGKTYLVNAGK